jgi:hypothetical protein
VLAEILDVAPRVIFDYAVRAPTRVEHRLLVRTHAGFRAFSERELASLGERLVEVALEHERPTLLLARVCEVPRAERVERPSIDRLVRLVGWARERAHELTFQRLEPQLTYTIRQTADGLLAADGAKSRHAWLRARPTTVSAGAMRRELEKRAFLIQTTGADGFDLSGVPPNRRAWLAQTGRQSTNQALARMAPERRYPVLLCFCAEALERATDDALEVNRAERILRRHNTGHLDILIDSSGASGRKLLSGVLAGVALKRSGRDDDELLAALR